MAKKKTVSETKYDRERLAHLDNMDSPNYAKWFFAQHGRYPTWADAMAHCPEHEKESWTWALKALEIDLNTPYFNQLNEVIANG
jgi:hypothetical protein